MLNVGDRDSLVKKRTECPLERVKVVEVTVNRARTEPCDEPYRRENPGKPMGPGYPEDRRRKQQSTIDRFGSKISTTASVAEQTLNSQAEQTLKRLWEEVPADISEDKRIRLRSLVLTYSADAMSRGPGEEQPKVVTMRVSNEDVMWARPIGEVTRIQKSPKSTLMVVHVDKLKPFYGKPPSTWLPERDRES